MDENLDKAVDLFGQEIVKDVFLRDVFLEPPFSVLDTKGGAWRNRKRLWKNLGIESEVSREGISVIENSFDGEKYGRSSMPTVSIFDRHCAQPCTLENPSCCVEYTEQMPTPENSLRHQ